MRGFGFEGEQLGRAIPLEERSDFRTLRFEFQRTSPCSELARRKRGPFAHLRAREHDVNGFRVRKHRSPVMWPLDQGDFGQKPKARSHARKLVAIGLSYGPAIVMFVERKLDDDERMPREVVRSRQTTRIDKLHGPRSVVRLARDADATLVLNDRRTLE